MRLFSRAIMGRLGLILVILTGLVLAFQNFDIYSPVGSKDRLMDQDSLTDSATNRPIPEPPKGFESFRVDSRYSLLRSDMRNFGATPTDVLRQFSDQAFFAATQDIDVSRGVGASRDVAFLGIDQKKLSAYESSLKFSSSKDNPFYFQTMDRNGMSALGIGKELQFRATYEFFSQSAKVKLSNPVSKSGSVSVDHQLKSNTSSVNFNYSF